MRLFDRTMDPSIEEAIASVLWAEPRLSSDVPELSVVSLCGLMPFLSSCVHKTIENNT